MTELKYWLWLTLTDGMLSRKINHLLERFETPLDIYKADGKIFKTIEHLSEKDVTALCDKSLFKVQQVIETCKQQGIRILTYDSPLYPNNLSNIFDPPYVLYVKSRERVNLNEHLMIAMVGNRNMTDYGQGVASKLSYDLARAGITIVSGMALGIDGTSHVGALRAGSKTVAVLGCGVDVVYPPSHGSLMNDIIQNGMVISEYPPGARPLAAHFPRRNRIISGLASGTVVIEATEKSGSLITADLTLEQGKEVFAVPGNITLPHSQGTNNLIKQGAKLVTEAMDIIEEYQEEYVHIFEKNIQNIEDNEVTVQDTKLEHTVSSVNEKYQELTDTEKMIVDQLSITPTHIDELVRKTNLTPTELNASMTMLEMTGLIRPMPGKHFVLNV